MMATIVQCFLEFAAVIYLYMMLQIIVVMCSSKEVTLTFKMETGMYLIYQYNGYDYAVLKALVENTPRKLNAKIGYGIVVTPKSIVYVISYFGIWGCTTMAATIIQYIVQGGWK